MRGVTIALLLISSAALAADKLPSKMDRVDVLEIENLELKMERLAERRASIFAKYGINPQELGRTVAVDEQGNIQRAPKPEPKPDPKHP